jgi:hypothetical protein
VLDSKSLSAMSTPGENIGITGRDSELIAGAHIWSDRRDIHKLNARAYETMCERPCRAQQIIVR